jgi:hypothetical protein
MDAMSTKVGVIEPQHASETSRFEVWAARNVVELYETGQDGSFVLNPLRARALAALLVVAADEAERVHERMLRASA